MPSPRFDRRGFLALAAAGAMTPTARAVAAPASVEPQIDAIVAKAMAAGPFPGVSVAIEQRGQVVYRKAFGFADLENRVPVRPETIFPIGSITKTMTGLAMTQLVVEGRVDLDAPASTYLPKLPAPARDIRVRHLLDHTSGLPNYTDIEGFPADSQKPFTREEMVGWFASRPLEFEPGTRWSYTNSGLYLAGLIIEAVTGQAYDAYLKAKVFEPFGMADTSVTSWNTILERRAHGYRRGKGGLQNAPRYDVLVPFAAGAVMSTADDLLKYRRGVFGDGPTTAQVRKHLLDRDSLADGMAVPYSLGCLGLSRFEGHAKIFHPGDIFGFAAQYAFYPDDQLTIAILTNNQNAALPPVSIEQKIARTVLGIPAPTIVDLKLDDAAAKAMAGDYQVGAVRFGADLLGFVFKDGALSLSFGGVASGAALLPLRYQGSGRFVSAVDDEHVFVFKPAAGTVEMFYYGGDFLARRAKAAA